MKQLSLFLLLSLLSVATLQAQHARIQRHARAVPGRYMVLLNGDISAKAYDGIVKSLAATYNLDLATLWPETPRGFITEKASPVDIERLATDPRVQLIEEDFEYQVLSGTQWTTYNGNYLWNLDRLDEPTYWVNDSTYDMCPEGRPIFAYLIDVGVRADHEQFTLGEPASRVVDSRQFENGTTTGVTDTTNGCTAGPVVNYNLWHGTATASVLAGTTVGAAKTYVISLRMSDCYGRGFASWIVNAVRWIRSSNDPWRYYPAVASYSGGVGSWETDFATLNTTVRNLVTTTQIPFFTSAENFAGDACMFSPNDLAYTNVDHTGVVFTVGGTSVGAGADRNDYRWQEWDASNQPLVGEGAGSDGGRCVSIYAPALGVYAARNAATNAYDIATGTSFSSPMTAAIAARYMELTGFTDYVNVYNYLLSAAASTGTVVNNVNTVEYWLCPPASGYTYPPYYTSRTSISTCPSGYLGPPVHVPATFNESHAGMVYSNMTCP